MPTELGGKLAPALANRLRISRAEASRRIHEAADLGERRALNGEPLPPVLAATAAAQRNGELGAGHVAVIRGFFHRLPDFVDIETRAKAEAQLAAAEPVSTAPMSWPSWPTSSPTASTPTATSPTSTAPNAAASCIGKQDIDGMSPINGWLTPEARATMGCGASPNSPHPACATPPTRRPASAAPRHRPPSRATPAAPANATTTRYSPPPAPCWPPVTSVNTTAYPTSIIVTTTLQELEAGAGRGLTGGGTLLPMSDVIRLGSHAHHYLAIFDNGKALALYHTKRLASPAQRIVLHAKDRGCTFPGCTIPGYLCEVHHCDPYATNPVTDVNGSPSTATPTTTLAEQGWTTRKNTRSQTEWIPPPHLDRGQPRTNTFHHPEKLCGQKKTTRRPNGASQRRSCRARAVHVDGVLQERANLLVRRPMTSQLVADLRHGVPPWACVPAELNGVRITPDARDPRRRTVHAPGRATDPAGRCSVRRSPTNPRTGRPARQRGQRLPSSTTAAAAARPTDEPTAMVEGGTDHCRMRARA